MTTQNTQSTGEKTELSFYQTIVTKYPSLFEKHGENGIPFYMVDCPPGWQPLVDTLLKSITEHCNATHRRAPTKDKWPRFKVHVLCWAYATVFDRWLHIPNMAYKLRKRFGKDSRIGKLATILDKIMRRIAMWLNSGYYVPAPPIPATILQIKEKFGGLRVYYSGGDDETDGMVGLAERLSFYICECDGKPGELMRRGYWYKTVCPECASKLGYSPISTDSSNNQDKSAD